MRRYDYDRAIADFSRQLRENPTHIESIQRRAEASRLLGRYEAALADYNHYIALRPNDDRALLSRSLLLSYAGRYREAIVDFTTSIEKSPREASVYLARGQAYSRLAEYPNAVADFGKSIELRPGHADTFLERGSTILLADGDLNSAVADFSRAVQLNPYLGVALTRRAETYIKLGKPDLAAADLTEAIRLDPMSPQLLSLRGEAFEKSGALSAALADYTAASNLDPANTKLLLCQARIQRATNRPDDAEMTLTKAIRLASGNVDFVVARAELLFSLGRHDAALADYMDVAHRVPDHAVAHHGQASVYLVRGDYEQAFAFLERALALDPKNPVYLYDKARCLSAFRRYDDAFTDANLAVEINPEYHAARKMCAEIHIRESRYEDAYADLAILVAKQPRESTGYFLRGLLESRRNRHEAAVVDYSKAIRLNPKYAEAYSERGYSHRVLKKNWAAFTDLLEAVQLDAKYAVEYLVQCGIMHGAKQQYPRAIADFAIALQLEPENKSALRGKSLVIDLIRKTKSKESILNNIPYSKDAASTTEAAILSGALLDHPHKPKMQRKAKKGTKNQKAKRKARLTVDEMIARQMQENDEIAPIQLTENDAIPVNVVAELKPQPVPGEAPIPVGTGVQKPLSQSIKKPSPLTGTGTIPNLKALVKAKQQSKSDKKPGLLAGLFGFMNPKSSANGKNAPKKLGKQAEADAAIQRKEKIKGYAKYALVPLGFFFIGYTLYDNLSGPSIAGALARAEAAGYPISHTITATDLWKEYSKDLAAANKKYVEKYAQVTGKVKKIINTPNKAAILLESSHATFVIECPVLNRDDLALAKVGADITLQGEVIEQRKLDANIILQQCKVRSE